MQNYKLKLVDSSRMIADILTADIQDNQERFDEMFALALLNQYPLSMRAARVVELSTFKFKKLILNHLQDLIDAIENSTIDGVVRSFSKIAAQLTLPFNESNQEQLANISFTFLNDSKKAIAIRAFSIDILVKISKNYPELRNELTYILEEMMRDSSAGLKSKAKKTLMILNKTKIVL